jgi:hypothetical protein
MFYIQPTSHPALHKGWPFSRIKYTKRWKSCNECFDLLQHWTSRQNGRICRWLIRFSWWDSKNNMSWWQITTRAISLWTPTKHVVRLYRECLSLALSQVSPRHSESTSQLVIQNNKHAPRLLRWCCAHVPMNARVNRFNLNPTRERETHKCTTSSLISDTITILPSHYNKIHETHLMNN